MNVLVTGAAGFIGMHVAARLLADGHAVTGVDAFDPYYDVALKEARAERLVSLPGFRLLRTDLADGAACATLFRGGFDAVVHLAAQPGVRYSLVNPEAYIRNNLVAFGHVLEGCRQARVGHLVYASSSSVYGANHVLPFSEDQSVDRPVSLYAATKKSNELMAHAYAHLFRLPCTGLRFFTVYGPWGRPDMAPMLFASAIAGGRPIRLFNEGRHSRDFTYVEDIAAGVIAAAGHIAAPDPAFDPASPDPSTSTAPYRIYNIGNSRPVELAAFVAALEDALGRPAVRELLPLQPGDVPDTFADTSRLEAATGWRAGIPVEEGVRRFVDWFRAWRGGEASARD